MTRDVTVALVTGALRLDAAGADWVGSPNSRRQAPPAMVAYAINLARNVRAKPTEDSPLDPGASIGSILSEQFKMDANQVRLGMAQNVDTGLCGQL